MDVREHGNDVGEHGNDVGRGGSDVGELGNDGEVDLWPEPGPHFPS